MPVSEPVQPDNAPNPEFEARLRADGLKAMRDVPGEAHGRIMGVIEADGRPPEGRSVASVWTFRRLAIAAVLLMGFGTAAWMLSRPVTPSPVPGPPEIAREDEPSDTGSPQDVEVASQTISPLRQFLDEKIADLNLEDRLEKPILDKAREILDRGDLLIRGVISRVPPSMQGSPGESERE